MDDLDRRLQLGLRRHGHRDAALHQRGIQRQHGIVLVGEERADARRVAREDVRDVLHLQRLGAPEVGKVGAIAPVDDDDAGTIEAGEHVTLGDLRDHGRRRLAGERRHGAEQRTEVGVFPRLDAAMRQADGGVGGVGGIAARQRLAAARQALAPRLVFGGDLLLGAGPQVTGFDAHDAAQAARPVKPA